MCAVVASSWRLHSSAGTLMWQVPLRWTPACPPVASQTACCRRVRPRWVAGGPRQWHAAACCMQSGRVLLRNVPCMGVWVHLLHACCAACHHAPGGG